MATVKRNKEAQRRAKGFRVLAQAIERIDAGEVEVNHRSKTGLSALMLATGLRHKDAISWLISRGADPRLADASGRDSFARADKDDIRELLQQGYQPGDDELVEATCNFRTFYDTKMIEPILLQGVSPCALNRALYGSVTCMQGDVRRLPVIELLLAQGARVEALLAPGRISKRDYHDIVQYVLYTPAFSRNTCLFASPSSESGRAAMDMLSLLRKHGLDVKAAVNTLADEESGTTLLMAVAEARASHSGGFAKELTWLLEQGADPFAKNKAGKTALELATDPEKQNILRAAMEKAGQ